MLREKRYVQMCEYSYNYVRLYVPMDMYVGEKDGIICQCICLTLKRRKV